MNITDSLDQPRVLLVTAHADHESLTWQITRSLAEGVVSDGVTGARILDLTAEGFDPTFTAEDVATYRGADPSEEVRRHQAIVDDANVMIVIFPVYWWSMPAIAKGWFDRVFGRNWAYDRSPEGKVRGLLGDRGLHLLPLAADKQDVFERHGYEQAMFAQIDHGILEYCGANPPKRHMFYRSEDPTGDAQREMIVRALHLGKELAAEAGDYKAAKQIESASDAVVTA